jgi:hypothetical protein
MKISICRLGMHCSRGVRRTRLGMGAVLLFAAQGASADGEFLQFDVSETTGSAVVSINRGAYSFGANHVRYEGGRQTTLNALYALPLG